MKYFWSARSKHLRLQLYKAIIIYWEGMTCGCEVNSQFLQAECTPDMQDQKLYFYAVSHSSLVMICVCNPRTTDRYVESVNRWNWRDTCVVHRRIRSTLLHITHTHITYRYRHILVGIGICTRTQAHMSHAWIHKHVQHTDTVGNTYFTFYVVCFYIPTHYLVYRVLSHFPFFLLHSIDASTYINSHWVHG